MALSFRMTQIPHDAELRRYTELQHSVGLGMTQSYDTALRHGTAHGMTQSLGFKLGISIEL